MGNLVRSVHLKRALSETEPDPHLNFWRLLYGHLLDVSVLEWCKLFGSDDEAHQQVHWKNVVPETDHEKFRAALLGRLQIDRAAWDNYWNAMKTYRDQHVAHLDFRKRDVTHYPSLDLALASVYFYYEAVIQSLRQQGEERYPDDMDDYCKRLSAQWREIAAQAIGATVCFEEKVY
jgi:hypothetical protein